MPVNPNDILNLLAKSASRPLSTKEILDGLNISSRKIRSHASRLLETLAGEGTLVRLKGDRYSLPRQVNLVTGTIAVHRDGYGFVRPAQEGKDVFVPARFLREVMDGDRVVVRVERSWRGAGPEGRVIKVLERAHRSLVGRYEAGRRFGYVVPADPRLKHDLFIPEGAQNGARNGQIVMARIDVFPGKTRNPEGTVVEVLGRADDPQVEILSIAHKHGLPYRFPEEVLAEAQAIPAQVVPEDFDGREDLRNLSLVTIDGETAKDFDDAVAACSETAGRTRLWVAIADVAHYVREASAIDVEALERGTSVYFPGQAIPMLPEKLSNGICSLNPDVDRLAMVAEMLFDSAGERLESRFYPAVIRSRARLTYTQVRDALAGAGDLANSGLTPQLALMAKLAQQLTDMRRRRGSLDFDLPEAEILLDLRGRPEDIVRSERNLAHRLIEEFMLAANEAVAAFLSERKVPLLYRVHESPDLERLQSFQEFISHFNIGLTIDPSGIDSRRLQKLLAAVEGKPEERVINQVLLRSMKQAQYAPENIGHFGLAAPLYCHFTSPIRRYPDLLVHRALRQALRRGGMNERRRAQLAQQLPHLGELTSQRERRAMEAEREMVALKKCQFMADKVGEIYAGFVSGVQPFGFFVELQDFFVEGLVHISSLADDFYHYEEDLHRLIGENRRRQFQVGAEVRVTVAKVDLERREIDFVLAEFAQAPPPTTKTKKRGGSKR